MVYQETVLLQGHIIDSLILAKVLDRILLMGGSFDLQEVQIGKTREDPSRAKIVVQTESPAQLKSILEAIQPHGASVERESDCRFQPAPSDGVFPDEFYATTHLRTQVRLRGAWINVDRIEMDLGIVVEPDRGVARAVPMASVKYGESVVIGREGVRVIPLQRPRKRDVFSFMESQVSVERPHGHMIHDITTRMRQLRSGYHEGQADCRILFSGGPAIIHAGGRDALAW
ncbi:MAG TPA: TIGR00300 family protein, partial [Nitrospira sp.]